VAVLVARAGRFLSTVARHALPVGGVFARDWHPVTAVAVYWLESVLLVLTATALAALVKRRASMAEVRTAGIEPRGVLIFHLGSLFVFGGFLGGVMVILIGNGHIAEPMRWGEVADAATAMAIVIAVGFTFDLWAFKRLTVAGVSARVNGCMARWGLLWMLGFFGTLAMMFTGRPEVFFGLFAGLKVTFESWAQLARFFGWRSVADRDGAAARS
jgi:hypothetical protein